MALLKYLVTLLHFAVAYGSGITTQQAVDSLVASLEKQWKIDSSNPPTGDVDAISEPTCSGRIAACSTTYFFNRETIQSAGAKVVITYNPFDTGLQTNATPGPATFTVSNSTAVLTSHTSGWTIGGQLSGNLGTPSGTPVSGGGDLTFSGSYTNTDTTSTTYTTTVTESFQCPSDYTCALRTYSFTANLTGKCTKVPMVTCHYTYNICEDFTPNACPQYDHYHDSNCPASTDLVDCTVSTPVYGADGNPLTLMVPWAFKASAPGSSGVPLPLSK